MDLLLVPYWADTQLDLIQWPPFLLASKVLFIFSLIDLATIISISNHSVVVSVAMCFLDPNCTRYG